MESILKEINGMAGVLGSFVCDEEGKTLARALPASYADEMLGRAGRTAAQTLTGLWMAKQRAVDEIDILFAGGRLIVKGLDSACLCILCAPRLNLPLLDMTAEVAIKKLQQAITGERLQTAAPPRRERLQQAARDVLGDRATRVVDMLAAAKNDTPEALGAVCDEAVRFIGFFMSQEKAAELGLRLRAILDE